MDAVELRRYELRSIMLREQERKELNQVKSFNTLIRSSEGEIKIKGEKIKGLREAIPTSKHMMDPAEQVSKIKMTLRDIKLLIAERTESEKNLKGLLQSRDSIIESISKIKAQNSKVLELSDAKKEALKVQKESAILEEATDIRGAQQRIDSTTSYSIGQQGFDVNTQDTSFSQSDLQIAQFGVSNGQTFFSSSQSHDASPSNSQLHATEQFAGRSWEEVSAGIRDIQTTQSESGASVRLNINSESGSEMKVEIEKRGDKNVRVRIQSGSEIDQRKIWLKKAGLVSALEKAGYSVEAVHVGGAK